MEQVGCDEWHLISIKVEWAGRFAFRYPNDTDNDSSLTGPLLAFASGVNASALRANPTQACGASVALANSVCSNQAKAAVGPKDVEGVTKEMGDKVRVTVRFIV